MPAEIIVMNTLNAAVTHWTANVQSVSGDYAAGAGGLLVLGADTDPEDAPIAARAVGPVNDWGTSAKKGLGDVYFSITGPVAASGRLLVLAADDQEGTNQEYAYPFQLRPGGISKAPPGMGILANRLAVGFENEAGANFRIDKIEVLLIASPNRRTA